MQLAGRAKPGSQGPLSPKEDREGLGGNRATLVDPRGLDEASREGCIYRSARGECSVLGEDF